MLSISLVMLGSLIVLFSIIRYYQFLIGVIAHQKSERLFSNFIYVSFLVIMGFFQIGYIFGAIIFLTKEITIPNNFLVAVIFLFGAVFVTAMISMVRRMSTEINRTAELEKQLKQRELKSGISQNSVTIEDTHRFIKSEFLLRMNFEMRTPMNTIIGMTNIGKTSREIAQKNDCFDKIGIASTHLLGVINDILDMSKIEENKLIISYADFNLKSMLEIVINAASHEMEEKNLHFTLSVDQLIPEKIRTDEQRLSQVITNLLSNAIKFTPDEGAISLFVRRVQADDDCKSAGKNGICTLQFEIKDTGIGISEEDQKDLFTSFMQTDDIISRRYGSAGLGLSISKYIVEKLNGNIYVKSTLGQGASFIFNIATEIIKSDHSSNQFVSDQSAGKKEKYSNNCFSHLRILVAEDIEINREIVSTLLEFTGITIDFAENGEIAYKLFTENPSAYNMIFMDIHMPEVDGYEATEKIRHFDNPRAKTIPIIAMTADLFHEDVKKCMAVGMNGHLGKPLEMENLLSMIDKYCA